MQTISKNFFVGSIVILVIICLVIGVAVFNIQNKLNVLQSNYNQLESDYNNLNNNLQRRLGNIESYLSHLNDKLSENDTTSISGQENVSIESVSVNNATTLTVYARSLSGGEIIIIDATIQDSSGNVVATKNREMPAYPLSASGMSRTIPVSFDSALFTSGNSYTVTLVTEKGNSFVSQPFRGT